MSEKKDPKKVPAVLEDSVSSMLVAGKEGGADVDGAHDALEATANLELPKPTRTDIS